MKISIDYDGTLWAHMGFFRQFMTAMQAAGHQVGILTGHNEAMKEEDLALMKARNFPIPDFWFGRTSEYQGFNGAKYKSHIILTENIDIHFDDFDFNDAETEKLFKMFLGDQYYRIMKVQPRDPNAVHYE